jgi:hypothetical protein
MSEVKITEKAMFEFGYDLRMLQDRISMLQDRIFKLESNVNNLSLQVNEVKDVIDPIPYNNIINRVTRLESSNVTQELDPKVWAFVNERLDKLEGLFLRMDHHEASLQRKWQANTELSQRLSEIEDLVNAIRGSYNNLCAPSLKQIPHKCPVCDGNKKVLDKLCSFTNAGVHYRNCGSCEGKGIVWG